MYKVKVFSDGWFVAARFDSRHEAAAEVSRWQSLRVPAEIECAGHSLRDRIGGVR